MSHTFVDERKITTMLLRSFCHWKDLGPYWLCNKRCEEAFLTLTVNYHKIVEKNKWCYSKQE